MFQTDIFQYSDLVDNKALIKEIQLSKQKIAQQEEQIVKLNLEKYELEARIKKESSIKKEIIFELQNLLGRNLNDVQQIIEQINLILKNVQEKEVIKFQTFGEDSIQNQVNNYCEKINEIENLLQKQEFQDLISGKLICKEVQQASPARNLINSTSFQNAEEKTEQIKKFNPLEPIKKVQLMKISKQASEQCFKKVVVSEEKKIEKQVPFSEKRIQELAESNLKLEQKIKELNLKCQIFQVMQINQQNSKIPSLLILRLNINQEYCIVFETEQQISLLNCRNILKVELVKNYENRFTILQKNFGGFSTTKLTFESSEEALFIIKQIEKNLELAKSQQKPNQILGQISTYLS